MQKNDFFACAGRALLTTIFRKSIILSLMALFLDIFLTDFSISCTLMG